MSQELSTEVYPSEDELYLALVAGDIDYHRFLILSEAIRSGIDFSNRHLFEDVPNLSYFLDDTASLSTYLEREQEAGFTRPSLGNVGGVHGELRYRHFQYLEEGSQSQYRLSGSFRLADWRASLNVRRDDDGVDRVSGRHIAYRGDGFMRELRFGSFTRRLGLGTAFGYRGLLLGSPARLDPESFLFPDYGGFNGVYIGLQRGTTRLQVLASVNRDPDHSLVSLAGMVAGDLGFLHPGVILGVNRLRNRHTASSRNDVKIAPTARYSYHGGYSSAEVCFQSGDRIAFGGVLVEGRHRFATAQVKYAAWRYGDKYLDLSGGGKTGASRRYHYPEDVEFEFSEKRSGHRGGMIKTIILMSPRTQLVSSLVYSGQHRDSSDLQLLSGLLQQIHPEFFVRFDHLVKTRRRLGSDTEPVVTSHRSRLEVRFTTGQAVVRGYIAYNTKSGRTDYLSAFVRLDYAATAVGKLQLWSNLARVDGRSGTVEYWYLFLRNEQPIWDDVTLAVKMSRTYDRDASERHRTALSLEVRATW